MYIAVLILTAVPLAGSARAQVPSASCVNDVSVRVTPPDLSTVQIHVTARALGQIAALPIGEDMIEVVLRQVVREPMRRPTQIGQDPQYVVFQIINGEVPRYLRLDLAWRESTAQLRVECVSIEAAPTAMQSTFVRTSPVRGTGGRLLITEEALRNAARDRIELREIVEAFLNPLGPAVGIHNGKVWIVGQTREGRPINLDGTERNDVFHLSGATRATADQRRIFVSRSGQQHDDPALNRFTVRSGLFRKRSLILPPGIRRKITQARGITFEELREAMTNAEALIREPGERPTEPRFYFVARLSSGRLIRVGGAVQVDGAIAILEAGVVDEKGLTVYQMKLLNKVPLVHL